jgi:NADPH:quinone reductase-like Zn-dependent oxidoreductase
MEIAASTFTWPEAAAAIGCHVEEEPMTRTVAITGSHAHGSMKAIVRSTYGPPDVLELKQIDRPEPADDEVLVRVRAAAVNPLDWYFVTGTPYIGRLQGGLRTPKSTKVGVDFAGTVEAIGKDVTQLRPGDEVFGARDGAFAEYLCARADREVALKPANLTFEEAAAFPVAALTALQGLRDKGSLRPGQRVLINGASGGVGTFAVQIAKALGAEVTGVCSTRNVELVRSLGADHVVDYTREDFARGERRYDLMLDIAGSRSWSACKRVLELNATVVLVGGPKTNRILGPVGHLARLLLASLPSSRKAVFFIAKTNSADFGVLRELAEAGTIAPAIDRSYPLSETAKALRYMGEGHARGKLVITI